MTGLHAALRPAIHSKKKKWAGVWSQTLRHAHGCGVCDTPIFFFGIFFFFVFYSFLLKIYFYYKNMLFNNKRINNYF
jgi:hypothetical protein